MHFNKRMRHGRKKRHLDACAVPPSGDKLAVGSAVVIDVCRGAEPQLRAVLAAAEHDGEVVLAGHQQQLLLLLGKLGYAA